jgi:dihydrofolate synthase/folylpolyglutamate synthase
MSYAAAIDQLSAMAPELHTQPGQQRRKFSLTEIGALLSALGDPHHRFPSVLIAGTNGKGSTAATLASILQASGLRVGLYTSPHLVRPNERIRLNSAEISDDAFARLYFQVDDAGRQLVLDRQLDQLPSFFETLTAMAFLYFAEAAIDLAVLEVGMGGRLDATNIVDPILSIVTDISLDHTEWLGPTIAAIAREKAGILRARGTLITLPQHPEANQVLGEVATQLGTRAVSAVPYMPQTLPHPALRAAIPSSDPTRSSSYPVEVLGSTITIDSPLHGDHQHRNIALALAAGVELAAHHSLPITPVSIEQGIRATQWPGRLEVITLPVHHSKELAPPQVVLDVAHNPAGAWALRAALRSEFGLGAPGEKAGTLLFSCLRDKPLAEMAQILFPLFSEVIFAPIHSPRATPMADLLAAAESVGVPARAASSVSEALTWAEVAGASDTEGVGGFGPRNSAPEGREARFARAASTEARPARRVAVAGSVYLVGEVRPLLLARAAELRGSEIAR